VEEAGGPAGYEVDTWVSLVASRGTPAELARRISADIFLALADAGVKERFKVSVSIRIVHAGGAR